MELPWSGDFLKPEILAFYTFLIREAAVFFGSLIMDGFIKVMEYPASLVPAGLILLVLFLIKYLYKSKLSAQKESGLSGSNSLLLTEEPQLEPLPFSSINSLNLAGEREKSLE